MKLFLAFILTVMGVFCVITGASLTRRVAPATAQPGTGSGDGHHDPHEEGWAAGGPGHWGLQLHHSTSVAGQ